jgi:unsaturated chondroitin disaccharide hydrolase
MTPSERPDTLDVGSFQSLRDYPLDIVDRNLEKYTDAFPSPETGPDLHYEAWPVEDWTPSFWTGLCWLAAELTGEERYREVAQSHLEHFRARIEGTVDAFDVREDPQQYGLMTHDLGFLYSLSAVAQYRLTGAPEARQLGLRAAERLADRYLPSVGIIQAWGDHTDPSDPHYGETIVDCMMNLPLLFWAAEETGYDRYRDIATRHATQTARHIVRDEGSTHHTFTFDPDRGVAVGHEAGTGAQHGPDTCWARGQAWAIYGFALAYRYTGEESFRDTSQDLAAYYLEHVEADMVPRWDFGAPASHMGDTSAAAIAACGLFELCEALPMAAPERARYREAALETLATLGEEYTTADRDSNAILTESFYVTVEGQEDDPPSNATIWGDYFYLEGLTRATTDWESYW